VKIPNSRDWACTTKACPNFRRAGEKSVDSKRSMFEDEKYILRGVALAPEKNEEGQQYAQIWECRLCNHHFWYHLSKTQARELKEKAIEKGLVKNN